MHGSCDNIPNPLELLSFGIVSEVELIYFFIKNYLKLYKLFGKQSESLEIFVEFLLSLVKTMMILFFFQNVANFTLQLTNIFRKFASYLRLILNSYSVTELENKYSMTFSVIWLFLSKGFIIDAFRHNSNLINVCAEFLKQKDI